MSYEFDSRLGEQLYQLLPEVYRTRDKLPAKAAVRSGKESLARYLDAHGHLLDLIHATLEQQLKDGLPESSQDWLLPYFAQLLAANIVSPDSAGKHAEIANAVSWRQRKGTLKCAEEIAEAVGEMEVEIQEGWKRVAMTPRIGMPVISSEALDDAFDIDMSVPGEAIRHPQLPATTVDLRFASRAVEAPGTNPAAKSTKFGGVAQSWRQANRHGVPCFPGSFEDVSRRTVDMRVPDAIRGHFHHKHMLAFAPPPPGLFPFDPIRLAWNQRHDSLYEHLIEEKEQNGVWLIRNKTNRILIIHNVTEEEPEDTVELASGKNYRVENLHFSGTLLLQSGRLELRRVEAPKVQVNTSSTDEPVLTAADCLFNMLSVGSGTALLDSCTILDTAYLYDLDAINCIFNDVNGTSISGVIQYSRIPVSSPFSPDRMTVEDCTTVVPELFAAGISYEAESRINNGAGVLRPDCDLSICAGASDGREMGYFHHGRKGRPVRISGALSFGLPDDGGYPLTDLIFEDDVTVTNGRLLLIRAAAPLLTVNTGLSVGANGEVIASLDATDCLFDELTVPGGLARLEYCTLMKIADCKHLQASDCIFAGSIISVEKPVTNKHAPSFLNCIRFSRVPADLDSNVANVLRLENAGDEKTLGSNTSASPVFIRFDYCIGGAHEHHEALFGEPGYGVLDSVAPDRIRFGAEDGAEMGAYHHKYYSLKAAAVLDKMREFLPVGIEPVLIRDTRLLHIPPEQTSSSESASSGGVS